MSDKYLRDEKQQLLNAIGSELSWGWSPAVDFGKLLAPILEERASSSAPKCEKQPAKYTDATTMELPKQPARTKEEEELDDLIGQIHAGQGGSKNTGAASEEHKDENVVSILLAGASDIRHILRTLATLRVAEAEREKQNPTDSQTGPRYDFYLYEPNLRVHCRHLFFLQWLVDSIFSLEEMEERVLMFLDVLGNANVRDITAAQYRRVVQRLLRGLEGKEVGDLMPLVDMEEMKLRERDFVEQQLRHWVRDASVVDLSAQWSQRVRQEMAERYDNRDNIIDWDFVFKLTDYSNLLKFPEYRTWRNTGVAYDVSHINPRRGFSYDYTVPNKTLCQFDRQGRGFYCGDVKNGPFFSCGATTENEHIRHRTTDGTCKYGNGVVSMHNIRAWLYTLMTGLAWPWADHAFAWDDAKNYNYLPPGTPSGVEYQAKMPQVRFHLVGLDFARFLSHQTKRGLRFDAAFFGTSCTQMMDASFFKMSMASDGVVVAETAKFVVDAEDEAKAAFVQKILSLGVEGGWEKDGKRTDELHEGQPLPRAYEGTLTKAQQMSLDRYKLPFQVVLRRRTQ